MQLYKPREFGDLFSDTFNFLRKDGVHYAKNYLAINGILFIITLLTFVPFISLFFEIPSFEPKAEGDFKFIFEENLPILLGLIAFTIVVITLINAIIYCFTPVYFKLYEEKGGSTFTTKEIIDELKSNYFKGIKVMTGNLLMTILLIIPLLIAVILVACTLVGIFIPIAAFLMLISFTIYQYLAKKENRFFASFRYAWDLVTLKFWHAVGCVACVMLISAFIQQIFSFILEMVLRLQTNPEVLIESGDFNLGTEFWIAIIISTLLSMVLQFVMAIITNTNMAITFYSLKAEKENITSDNTIDEIGRAI